LAADRPVIYEVLTDPEVPTLPPHITFSMAKNFMSSMFSDPNAANMTRGTLKDAIQSVLPHKK
jgi:pyruvate dehydrogenase (quinone)